MTCSPQASIRALCTLPTLDMLSAPTDPFISLLPPPLRSAPIFPISTMYSAGIEEDEDTSATLLEEASVGGTTISAAAAEEEIVCSSRAEVAMGVSLQATSRRTAIRMAMIF